MRTVERMYYPLKLASVKLNCSVNELLHLGATGQLEICGYVNLSVNNQEYAFHVHHECDYYKDVIDLGVISGGVFTVSSFLKRL